MCAGVASGKRKLLLACWVHLAGNRLHPAPLAFLTREGGSPLERLVNSTSRLWLNKQLSRRLRRLRFICFGGPGAGSLGRGACWGHTGGRLQLPARVTQRPGPIKGKRGQVWSGGDLEYLPSRGELLSATVCNGRRTG